jgi:hypothetical protein
VGGLLESMSYWTGIRSLLLLAAILYCASWLALGREMRRGKKGALPDSLAPHNRVQARRKRKHF